MAGFVFVPYSAHGHVNPMLPVIAELVARGERVRVVAGGRFARQVTSLGASAMVPRVEHQVRVPARWRAADLADRARLRMRRRMAWRAAAEMCAEDFAADRPDLLVVDPMAPWSGRLARRLDIAAVRFWTTHARSPHRAGLSLVNSLPEFQPGRHRFGADFQFVGPLVAPDLVEHDDLLWRPEPGRPVLMVSPGTVFARRDEFFAVVVREFGDTEWLVLIATGHTPVSALGDLPANIVARSWLPQRRLLAHASVLLTHGGMNSVQEALVHGVPMLLAPRSREQQRTTTRVVQLGLGRRFTRLVYSDAQELAADPAVRAAHEVMSDRARSRRGARLAADQLVRYVAGSRGGVVTH